ncbi:MAG TPA: RT0821/Lpp0805 family surface protein [Candidatus Cybelea sp.]|nr:RT0821/Lpp0805 family surface protein [Candidatus Cybelea sp.]
MTSARKLLMGAVFAALPLALSSCAGDTVTVGQLLDAGDLGLINQTSQEVLEKGKVGESANWENGANGHRGTVTPVKTYTQNDGTPCRSLQQTATVGGRTVVAYDTACRGADGVWSSINNVSLAQSIVDTSNGYGPTYNYGPYYGPCWYRYDPWCYPPYYGPPYWRHYPYYW